MNCRQAVLNTIKIKLRTLLREVEQRHEIDTTNLTYACKLSLSATNFSSVSIIHESHLAVLTNKATVLQYKRFKFKIS